jgi:hypothetical protein
MLPVQKILNILQQHLPKCLYFKLSKFINSDLCHQRTHVSWTFFQDKLEKLTLDKCSHNLLVSLENMTATDDNVQTFHIENNLESVVWTEPTHINTTKMIYKFINYIYKRNILASLTKYIILKSLLDKFKTSQLTETNKGVFSLMYNRLQEIIFECVLLAFNGSNYDNYLICNSLIIILTNLNHKIKIFKKGSSISTIKIDVKNNFSSRDNIFKYVKRKPQFDDKWPMVLFIKDIRNLVAANMSLDKIGKLFNLTVSKLCFPYDQATSIESLKTCESLKPYNEDFWRDNFSGKVISLQTRIEAQQLFILHGFNNLYEYSNYYLIQDCLLLHSIVLTLFQTYLSDSINIFLRRNYSQSNLSYQQFFIIEPAKQITNILAPKHISNSFCNYFIKLAVTGGLCTSFVQGEIDNNTIINEHLNYVQSKLDPNIWPNFAHVQSEKKPFQNKGLGISTIDIRSLYPSASVKKLPVGTPLIYSRFTNDDSHKNIKSFCINVQSFCENVRMFGDYATDKFRLLNTPPRFFHEYNAINQYLATLPKDINIIRFQSNFTALGQLFFGPYPVDGFLTYTIKSDPNFYLHIKIIQYQSVFRHGHLSMCSVENNDDQKVLHSETQKVKANIKALYNHYVSHFGLNHIQFEYVELSECNFILHKIPIIKPIIFPFKSKYKYQSFLEAILAKQLTGYIVVKDLEIKKSSQNPIFGFIIQKVQYELKHLSDYTQKQLKHFYSSQRVISVHASCKFMILSTEYFLWLHNTFGFENTPDIYHAMLFQLEPYLKSQIETKLKMRRDFKSLIKNETNLEKKQIMEIKAELLKLMLNSCYGFTLCNLVSSKFKCFTNYRQIPTHNNKRKNLISCIQLLPNVFLAEIKKNLNEPFETMLGHVGCSILFYSKIILLKRLDFLIRNFDPTKVQLLYMDTDSAHFLVASEKFEDNVNAQLLPNFQNNFNKHFETGDKISGIWVQEGFFDAAKYIGEKCYILYDKVNNNHVSHMKGCNTFFQQQFIHNNVDHKKNTNISYNIFSKSHDFAIFKTYMSKDLFSNYIPIKRYFISSTGSLPLKIWK